MVTTRLLPRLIGHNAFDPFRIAIFIHEELAHSTLPGTDICYELLQVYDASAGKGGYGLVGSGDDIDHFTIVDVVRVSGDFFEQFKVLTDPLCDVIYRVGTDPKYKTRR